MQLSVSLFLADAMREEQPCSESAVYNAKACCCLYFHSHQITYTMLHFGVRLFAVFFIVLRELGSGFFVFSVLVHVCSLKFSYLLKCNYS